MLFRRYGPIDQQMNRFSSPHLRLAAPVRTHRSSHSYSAKNLSRAAEMQVNPDAKTIVNQHQRIG